MADILKTWPAAVEARTVARIFSATAPPWSRYYFALGRGKPKTTPTFLWFNYQGRILGKFVIEQIACNDGTFPELRRLDGGESAWQIRRDAWVAICAPPCLRIRERVFHESFRGWRYFDFESYRQSPEARHRL